VVLVDSPDCIAVAEVHHSLGCTVEEAAVHHSHYENTVSACGWQNLDDVMTHPYC
jgi:hypothetical protein